MLYPQTSLLTFQSSPAGLQLAANSSSATAPFTQQVIVNSTNSVSAPSPQTVGSTTYTFSSWSDGGAQSHTITAPAANTTYTATYTGSAASSTLGYTGVGATLDSYCSNYMTGSRITVGGQARTVTSVSVYVGPVDSGHKSYGVAIYTDSGGAPKTLVASSATGTLIGNAWNTLSLSATLAANSAYWLVYNANSPNPSLDDLYFNTVAGKGGVYNSHAFGSWPGTFGSASLGGWQYSIYATVH